MSKRRRGDARQQLEYLHLRHGGVCHVCRQPADLGVKDGPDAPCRFRVRSGFGEHAKGRVRPKVMAHRRCAQERSDQIQNSISVDERRDRAGSHPLSARELSDVLYHFGHGAKT